MLVSNEQFVISCTDKIILSIFFKKGAAMGSRTLVEVLKQETILQRSASVILPKEFIMFCGVQDCLLSVIPDQILLIYYFKK